MRLPNFLVVGAARSGSTYLHSALRKHPDIFLPKRKELLFFSRETNYVKGVEWYQQFFFDVGSKKMVGEVTPNYMFCPQAPYRIKSLLGSDVRIVFILRNPISMVYSHYLHHYCAHKQKKFSDYLVAWDDIVRRGYYIDYIEAYDNIFDYENIYILFSERMFDNPTLELDKLCDFLQVKSFSELGMELEKTKVNYSSATISLLAGLTSSLPVAIVKIQLLKKIYQPVKNMLSVRKGSLTNEDRMLLDKIYSSYNQRLAERIIDDIPW